MIVSPTRDQPAQRFFFIGCGVSVERPHLDFYPSVRLQAADQLGPWLLHVALDQGPGAAFADGLDQFARYAFAHQIGLDGLRPLPGNLQVALGIAELIGVPGDDDFPDVGSTQQLAGDRTQLALTSVMVSIERNDWVSRLLM